MSQFIMEKGSHSLLFIRVQPGAKKSSWGGLWMKNHIKVRIQAPPVDGAANKALIEFVSKELEIKNSSIKLISGEKAREKTLYLEIPKTHLENRLRLVAPELFSLS